MKAAFWRLMHFLSDVSLELRPFFIDVLIVSAIVLVWLGASVWAAMAIEAWKRVV